MKQISFIGGLVCAVMVLAGCGVSKPSQVKQEVLPVARPETPEGVPQALMPEPAKPEQVEKQEVSTISTDDLHAVVRAFVEKEYIATMEDTKITKIETSTLNGDWALVTVDSEQAGELMEPLFVVAKRADGKWSALEIMAGGQLQFIGSQYPELE